MQALVFNDHAIRDRSEMLCLTDMWRAAGADPSKRPAKWREILSVQEFVQYLETTIRNTDSEPFQSLNEGGENATWAHWQIGMAYAKYLSPECHAWCNAIVRAHMEGRRHVESVPASAQVTLVQMRDLLHETVKPLHEQAARTHDRIDRIEGNLVFLANRVNDIVPRRDFSKEIKQQWYRVVRQHFSGYCPCCKKVRIVDDGGQPISGVHSDHFNGRERNKLTDGWPVDSSCNYKLEHDADFKREKKVRFDAFQEDLKDIYAPQPLTKVKTKTKRCSTTNDLFE